MPSSSSSSSPSFFQRLFNRTDPREGLRPLYKAVIGEGRQPHWYVEGAVPDTLDGRFDMIVAILALALIRLEQQGAAQDSVWLTEVFVDDMDGQLRQEGVGDVVVGKHIGRMMSALGGRISAYRDALTGGGDLAEALRRNLYRGAPVGDEAVAHVEGALRARWTRMGCLTRDALLAGDLG
ncbi:ubiquinol-cytochrome C chaperone family protein [Sphingobium sp. HBC34]|uniref:Ubiquinol-cytochrome C chaperone family protein n=1 Tax=Sphingobium cyanobacteriorum TaxID=3063954 RepID=A0ABT8ZMJ7_9SPHN|nr:ubiquinol-cytochrome C chaperone family protein [Sphingobium sp. HBC34]MDO7835753.1 ubiquinol-cytochrome C chaperone family protein [Sphingobium sp. HBC34]